MKTLQFMIAAVGAAFLIAPPTRVVAQDEQSTPAAFEPNAPGALPVPSTFGVFIEPLIAFDAFSAQQWQDLQTVAREYQSAGDPTQIDALQKYLTVHPESPWRGSILANIGFMFEREFFISKSLDFLAHAQSEMTIVHTPAQRAIADAVIGAQLRLHAQLGHVAQLNRMLESLGSRPLYGGADSDRAHAQSALYEMQHEPETALRCGLVALREALKEEGASSDTLHKITELPAKKYGMSLADLSQIAARLGHPMTMLHLQAGDTIPVPSVMHLKEGHFGALVEQQGDRFRLRDGVLGHEIWIRRAALDSESTGYFLAGPRSNSKNLLRLVTLNDARHVIGAGNTTNPVTPPPPDACDSSAVGMPVCSINNPQTSLTLTDTPLEYTPPFGSRIAFKLKYFQYNSAQPANFTFSNVSPMWSYNWMAFIRDDPTSPGNAVSLYSRDGGYTAYSGYNAVDGSFMPEQYSQAQLVETSTSPVTYERRMKDGSKEVYAQSNGATVAPRTILLTSIVDPFGNTVTLSYDSQNRLTGIKDALNQQTTLAYTNTNPLLITKVSDPFGRNVTLGYDTLGRLASLTDVIGMTTTFTYDTGTFVTSMTTPYGTTQYAYSQAGYHWTLTTTDPLGYSDRQEFLHAAAGIPFSETLLPANTITPIYNAYINYRDSYYWDKAVVQSMGSTIDYTKARISHWEHLYNDFSYTTPVPILESTKNPLENRVWYFYANQPNSIMAGPSAQPNQRARVLDDGTTQSFSNTYNVQGNTVSDTDPANRGTFYDYAANGIDVTKVRRVVGSQTDVLAQFTYNSQHLPLTYIDAAGQTTTYTYNARGQIATVKDAKGATTTYQYNTAGYLTGIVNANSVTQRSFTYDSLGRVASATDSEGYTLSYQYDALNRQTVTTFPDGTKRTVVWNKLDIASETNRLGKIIQYTYDGARNRITETDAIGNVTHFGYDPAGRLVSQTDASGHQTAWARDIQGRIISKTYSAGDAFRYTYDGAGRLLTRTDPLGQIKTFNYTVDDQPSGYTYTNAVNSTPAVTITYDPLYPRPTAVQDGTGTTVFKYVPAGTLGAGQIAEEDSPDGGSAFIKNTYDPLSRILSRTIGSASEALTYDTIGRVTLDQSALGAFQYGFLGQTGQVNTESLQGSTWQTTYGYGTNLQDRQLQAISHPASTGASNISYATGPENQILSRTDAQSVQTSPYDAAASYVVDGDNRVQSANALAWLYDANGNVLDDGTNTYQWDAENRVSFITNKSTGHVSQFRYDGLSRRTVIIEKPSANGTPVETHYLWCGGIPCESHNATGQQLALYFPQGEIATGSNSPHFYARDSLGSVMQVVDANGALLGGAGYTNYGKVMFQSGVVPTFGYAGMFQHLPSLTNLAKFRVYSPSSQRWLSRDPIEERGGRNLYAYVGGNPLNLTDLSGLCPEEDKCDKLTKELDQLVNAVRKNPQDYKGLAQRFRNLRNLSRYAPGEVGGHAEQIEARQRELKKKIQEYIDAGCGDPPSYATEYANKPIPTDTTDQSSVPTDPQTQQQIIEGVAEVGSGWMLLRFLVILGAET